jgi:hypothetical protein
MTKENYLYKGNVQIYLQGEKALLPVASRTRNGQISYFIGSKKSKLLIRDFRREPIHAAHASAGLEGAEFADAFNQPAYAEVSISERGDEPEKIEINLRPTNKSDDFPVLWLGVLNDAMMPMLDIEWEILRPINAEKIAFTAMVRFDKKN